MTPNAARALPEVKPPATFLYPGQLHAGNDGGHVTTILGTCVAVCLWEARAQVGGVNHYLLARPPVGDPGGTRYGASAIPELFAAVVALGARPSRVVAKVFGGMDGRSRGAGGSDIGGANVELALAMLADLRVPVATQDVGGPRGRRLIFDLSSGDAWVKTL